MSGDEENGKSSSYYASPESNLRNARPGQPPGRQVTELKTNPTREWVKRNAPQPKADVSEDTFFFSGTSVIKTVGKDEGLTGIRCMTVINDRVWIGEREGCFSVWDYHTAARLFRSTKKKDIFVWSILGPVNGNLAWVGSSDSFIRVFNSDTLELVKEMKEHVGSGGVYCLADTPGSRLVFSGSGDFTIVKWDGIRAERLAQFNGHHNAVRALVVVGRTLFSGSDDQTIKLWDTKTGAILHSFEQHTKGVRALAFACGKYLWSASEDETIRIWNPDLAKSDTDPCIKVLDSPHTGQINCLTLIGSLIWSSSWNSVFVWDPETMELKGQYRPHEGCINALLPVHQAVVSRVWSASNDGVINLWDTECTFKQALSAASDGRLEEVLVQLEDSQAAVEAAKKKTASMEQVCVQLNSEKDRIKFTMQSQQEKHDHIVRDLKRKLQEADHKNVDYKARLEKMGAEHSVEFDDGELLEAFQKGMVPGSVMPEEYEDDSGLPSAERDRRAKLRDAFEKGKKHAAMTGSEEQTRSRFDQDEMEARLKAALERAYRNGDVAGVSRLRKYLDENFPGWQDSAAGPIVPISYLTTGESSDAITSPLSDSALEGDDYRARLRKQFLEGLLDSGLDSVPPQPTGGTTEEEMAAWRARRDAYVKGTDARRIFPSDILSKESRAAYARGLGMRNGTLPNEFADSDAVSASERQLRAQQRSAFLRGRYATRMIPTKYQDDVELPEDEREKLRKLREHFLYGLTLGPNVELPTEYHDSPSDLSPQAQLRRETARKAFTEGQNMPSLIPTEYTESMPEKEKEAGIRSLRSELRDQFLQGLAQGEAPVVGRGYSENFTKQLEEAYKRGWLAGCPFAVELPRARSEPGSRGGSKGPSPVLLATSDPSRSPQKYPDALPSLSEELEQRRMERHGSRTGIERHSSRPGGIDRHGSRHLPDLTERLEELERENAELRTENERLLKEHRQTIHDLNLLREQLAAFEHGASVQIDTSLINPVQLGIVQELIEETRQGAGTETVEVRGIGNIPVNELNENDKQKLMKLVAHQSSSSTLKKGVPITVGGQLLADLPILEDLSAKDRRAVTELKEKYNFIPRAGSEANQRAAEGVHLPDWRELEAHEEEFVKGLIDEEKKRGLITIGGKVYAALPTTQELSAKERRKIVELKEKYVYLPHPESEASEKAPIATHLPELQVMTPEEKEFVQGLMDQGDQITVGGEFLPDLPVLTDLSAKDRRKVLQLKEKYNFVPSPGSQASDCPQGVHLPELQDMEPAEEEYVQSLFEVERKKNTGLITVGGQLFTELPVMKDLSAKERQKVVQLEEKYAFTPSQDSEAVHNAVDGVHLPDWRAMAPDEGEFVKGLMEKSLQLTVGGHIVPELPPLKDLSAKDRRKVTELREKYSYVPSVSSEANKKASGGVHLPDWKSMTPEEETFVKGLMDEAERLAIDPALLSPRELTLVQELVDETRGDGMLVKVPGMGTIPVEQLSKDDKARLMSVVAEHSNPEGREQFRKTKGLVTVGGQIIPELPALDEMKVEDQAKVMAIQEKYNYNAGQIADEKAPSGVHLPGWAKMTETEGDYLRGLMMKHRNLTPNPSPQHRGKPSLESPPMVAANATAQLSDAVAEVLEDPSLSSEVRAKLTGMLSNETVQSPEVVRTVVKDSALPLELKSELLQNVLEAEDESATTLEGVVRQLVNTDSRQPQPLPLEIKRQFVEALDDNEADEYGKNLEEASRKAIMHSGVSSDAKKQLTNALGENAKRTAELYGQVKTIINDGALSQDVRLALQDALAPASRTHHVPEAVRELLNTNDRLPRDVRRDLETALEGHDNRNNELADTVADNNIQELQDAVSGPRSMLPNTVRAVSMDPRTDPIAKRVLAEAYATQQGRTAAADDMARSYLYDKEVASDCRRQLRNAIFRSGVSGEEVLQDAVLYAIAQDDMPEKVCDDLFNALQSGQAKQGNVCQVVRTVIENENIPPPVLADLRPALLACETRAVDLSATLNNICERRPVGPDVRKQLKDVARGSDSRFTTLEETIALISERDDVPENVRQDLFDAMNANADRAAGILEALDKNKDVLANLSPASRTKLAAVNREDPVAVSAAVREVLGDNERDLPARRVLYTVLVEADEKAVLLHHAARTASQDVTVPEDCRKQLRKAIASADAAADAAVAGVRQALCNSRIPPATRQSLHVAAAEANGKYHTLAEAVRSNARPSSQLGPQARNDLSEAAAVAAGRAAELYHSARLAAHNTAVPPHVRQVLREALGEDGTAVTETAVDALAQEGVPEYRRSEILEAFADQDEKSAELKDAVQEVLDTYELPAEVQEDLTSALDGVKKSDESLRQAVDASPEATDQGLRNEDNVSEVVRQQLLKAGIGPTSGGGGGIASLSDALARNDAANTQFEDLIRGAVNKGQLPSDAEDKLRIALEEKKMVEKSVQRAVSEAAADPNMPLPARQALDEVSASANKDDDAVELQTRIAHELITSPDLPKEHRQAVREALITSESRLQVLREELKSVSLPASVQEKVQQATTASEIREAVRENNEPISDDVSDEVSLALARHDGKAELVRNAIEDVAHDPAVTPEIKSKISPAEATPEDRIAAVQRIMQDPELQDTGAAQVLEDAVREAQSEVPSTIQQSKNYQKEQLQVELQETLHSMKELKKDLRRERDTNEGLKEDYEDLQLTVKEYERLMEAVGGKDEFESTLANTQKLEQDRIRKQQELDELQAAIDTLRLENPNADMPSDLPTTSPGVQPGRSPGMLPASRTRSPGLEPAQEALDARRQQIREAYLAGKGASLVTPLPQEYRKQAATTDADVEMRGELAHAWLKGRQEALGSVVPPEYAEVKGVTEEEAAHRADMRTAYLEGLKSNSESLAGSDVGEDFREAWGKGKKQRQVELRRAGSTEEDAESEAVKMFSAGVEGEADNEIDATILAAGMPKEKARDLAKVFGRAKWIRNDILGDGTNSARSLSSLDRSERLDNLAMDKSRLAQLLDELNLWHGACDDNILRSLGYPAPSPAYVRALQQHLEDVRHNLVESEALLRTQTEKLRVKERQLEADHKNSLSHLEKEREYEVDRLKGLVSQLESDLNAKTNVHTSLNNRIDRLTEQLGKRSAENEILTQELIKKASIGDVTELVTYYTERERKWNELSQLNRELQVENKTLLTESTALAHKLRALSFVFESRPTLVRSLYELHKLLAHIPQTLHGFSKEANKRQLPRLEILDEIKEVNVEVDTCKDGTRWIIANLFTSYELQHLGTSPQFFIPDVRRPTWRDIQVPTKQRELLLSTWVTHDGSDPTDTKRSVSPPHGPAQASHRRLTGSGKARSRK